MDFVKKALVKDFQKMSKFMGLCCKTVVLRWFKRRRVETEAMSCNNHFNCCFQLCSDIHLEGLPRARSSAFEPKGRPDKPKNDDM